MSNDLPENKPGDDVPPAVDIRKLRVASTSGGDGPLMAIEFADDSTPPQLFRISFTEREFAFFLDDIRSVVERTFPRRRN